MNLSDITKKVKKIFTNEDGDILFEGGFGDGDQNHKKQPGIIQKVFCCGGKTRSSKNHDGNERDFNQLTDEQKKERIQYLWNQARRYNQKLRF